MKITKEKNFKHSIILLKILDDNSLLVVDSNTTVRYLNQEDLSLKTGFKAKIKHTYYKNSVIDFSGDGEYFASLSNDSKEAMLFNAKSKKNITRFTRHQGEVSTIAIDPRDRYLFSSGDDGKTFAIDLKSGKLAFTLPVHVDTVNDIEFSKNGQWVATCSYDRKVSIFNLAMMTPKHKLKAHSAPVMKLHFLSKHRLLSVDNKSKVIIWDIYSGKVIHRLQGVHDNVTQITSGSEDRFLFLGTSLGYVLVYDMETYEILDAKYIKVHTAITSMIFEETTNNLILGLDDGSVQMYNIFFGEDFLKELLKQRDVDAIEAYVVENQLLTYTPIYQLISNLWERTFEKAKQCLEKGDRKTAISLFETFKNIPYRNIVIQKTLKEYLEFNKFVKLAKEKKYPLAYGIANQHPLYKESKIYKSLEAQWLKVFKVAQKYVLDPKGMDMAKEVLAPYRGISDKTKLIQELLTQGEIYKRFRVSIGQKDFRLCFELIKQHPFLKEFPEYETIMNYADTLYIKSQKSINDGDTHSAIKSASILNIFIAE